jgi:predicted nucleotidyltransferase component of viral defense system
MTFHEHIMLNIAKAIATTTDHYVLKGGTALRFGRNLDRTSTDLDYDTDKKLALNGIIKQTITKTGAKILEIKKLRDSELNQKIVTLYASPNGTKEELKIETRIFQVDFSLTERTNTGLRIYNTTEQLKQKLTAANSRGARAPRDLYDIGFLASKFPEAATNNTEEFIKFGENIETLQNIYKKHGRMKKSYPSTPSPTPS